MSRGDMLVHPGNQPQVGDHFDAVVVWMSEEAMVPGKPYLVKHTTTTVPAAIKTLRYKFDVNTLSRQDGPTLGLNEIGRCEMTLAKSIMYDGYRRNRSTGAFIVIDRLTNVTGAGMVLDGSSGATKDALGSRTGQFPARYHQWPSECCGTRAAFWTGTRDHFVDRSDRA